MTSLPKHNPFLRILYILLIFFMVLFFSWMFLDDSSLYYVGYAQTTSATDFESCKKVGGKIYEGKLGWRCYMSETVYFDKEKTKKEILKSVKNFSDCKKAGGEIHATRCYLNKDLFFVKKSRTISATDFESCQKANGEIYEGKLGWRCYMSETVYFDKEKTKKEILKSVKNFSDCKKAGGEIYGSRCYISKNLSFDKSY